MQCKLDMLLVKKLPPSRLLKIMTHMKTLCMYIYEKIHKNTHGDEHTIDIKEAKETKATNSVF